ncbi:MAG: type II toxin-antitoxin system RelE/ParE family toxin [Coprococcus sp.]|nr:type II toxin-antitoxin system RelE/ParE family toxin [Coprococcus sp.]
MKKRYRVVIAQSGKLDVENKKRYIIETFKYRSYAEKFSQQIKEAAQQLDTLPYAYGTTGFRYRGYNIYIKPQSNHLLFYTVNEETQTVTVLRVLQDGMDWEYIIEQWIKQNF